MEPGVPFALLGVVVLLAVVAWVGLGAAALVRSAGRGTRAPALVLAAGSVVLAVVEGIPVARFGVATSDLLPLARAAGAVLLAAGLYGGAFASPPRRAPAAVGSAPGIVVPLSAAPAPAALAALAGLLAVLAAVRVRRDPPGLLLAAGLLLSAVAAALGALADAPGAALAVLLCRAAAALLLLAFLGTLAQASLLGKVVTAVLAGVALTATAAVAVVGTVVVELYEREQRTLVRSAAATRVDGLQQTLITAQVPARIAARACERSPVDCAAAVREVSPPGQPTFAAQVPAQGSPRGVGGRAPLTQAEVISLAGSAPVRAVLTGAGGRVGNDGLPSTVRLVGREPALALAVVVPTTRRSPDAAGADAVFVYGVRLDDTFAGSDATGGTFAQAVLVDGRVTASSLPERQEAVVQRVADRARIGSGLPPGGRTVPAEGDDPTVHFEPLTAADGRPVGVLAVARPASVALAAQRTALAALLATALLATAVMSVLALLLGRRTVEPVRRLTAAASRVAAGDLTVTTRVAGRDEVGTLSRTFDAMTASVSRLTGDLQASAARLDTVLSSMTDGLVATAADGTVTSVNRAALAMVGLPDAAAALGRPLGEVVDVRVGGERLDVTDGRAAGGEVVPAEVHRSDGTTVPVRVAVAPLDDGEGAVLVLRDTTQEREVERMKTEFLSNVSHELRTPLTPIRGYAEILVGKPGLPPDKVTSFATTIRDESIKMNRVVDLLVDVAAIEAGRVTVDPRPVRPADLVDARLAAWRSRVPARAADLKRRVATRLPAVEVDPVWVGKALDELIDNAVKYTPPGTPITLSASRSPDGEWVRVAVRDAGPGIAAADQASLFLSFEQVDGSATRRVGGLGLGLSFVRRLAQDAGFPLTVTSTPGRGAEFALDLPVAGDLPEGGDVPAPGGRAASGTGPPAARRGRPRLPRVRAGRTEG